jgi:hypothetical protein
MFALIPQLKHIGFSAHSVNLKYIHPKVIVRTPGRFDDAPPNELMLPLELLQFIREFSPIKNILIHHQTSR